jgi:hypothetical protein
MAAAAAANMSSSALPSVLASTKSVVGANFSPNIDMVLETLTAASPWTIFITIVAMCVVYDQSMSRRRLVQTTPFRALALSWGRSGRISRFRTAC